MDCSIIRPKMNSMKKNKTTLRKRPSLSGITKVIHFFIQLVKPKLLKTLVNSRLYRIKEMMKLRDLFAHFCSPKKILLCWENLLSTRQGSRLHSNSNFINQLRRPQNLASCHRDIPAIQRN